MITLLIFVVKNWKSDGEKLYFELIKMSKNVEKADRKFDILLLKSGKILKLMIKY